MKPLLVVLMALVLLVAPVRAEMAVTETTVQVQVRGAVKRPGVYHLPAGSRVAELIAQAGGPRADAELNAVNLTQRLEDGLSLYLPTRAEARRMAVQAPVQTAPVARRAPARAASRSASRVVNLNSATQQELETLPGIGPGLAAAILRVRQRLGRFRSVEDLREVQGIGKKRFERLKPLVTVS